MRTWGEMQQRTEEVSMSMDWKLELVPIPVSDVDRAKAFYAEKVGFDVDHDVNTDNDPKVSGKMRVVQLTPPGRPARSPLEPGSWTRRPALSRPCTWSSRTSTRRVWSLPNGGRGRRGPGSRGCPVRLLQRPGRKQLGLAAAALLAKPGIGDDVEARAAGCLRSRPMSAS